MAFYSCKNGQENIFLELSIKSEYEMKLLCNIKEVKTVTNLCTKCSEYIQRARKDFYSSNFTVYTKELVSEQIEPFINYKSDHLMSRDLTTNVMRNH